MREELKLQPQKNNPKQNKLSLIFEKLSEIRIDATFLVLLTFILLQIFRLIDLLITNKTLANILVIPFQLIIFIVPTCLFAFYKDREKPLGYIANLRIKLPAFYQIPLILSGFVAMAAGCLLISIACGGTESLTDGFTLYNTFVSGGSGGFLESLLLVIGYAALPAVCEELIYRGIICREFEKYNVLCAILASGVFFALLHFDLRQFPVYLFSGVILALSMYATGSLLVPIIIHFLYNLMGLFGQSFLNAFYQITGSIGLFAFLLFIIGMLGAALFCAFASKSYKIRAKNSTIPDHPLLPPPGAIPGIVAEIFLTPWSIAAVCLYILVLVVSSIL